MARRPCDAQVKFGFDEIYRSAWFIVVLGLMAMNLILVTWLRVPHVWKIARAADATLLKDPLVPKTAFQASWETPLSPVEALDRGPQRSCKASSGSWPSKRARPSAS